MTKTIFILLNLRIKSYILLQRFIKKTQESTSGSRDQKENISGVVYSMLFLFDLVKSRYRKVLPPKYKSCQNNDFQDDMTTAENAVQGRNAVQQQVASPRIRHRHRSLASRPPVMLPHTYISTHHTGCRRKVPQRNF